MSYRHTENVVRHLAEREKAIITATTGIVAETGIGAVQIAAVAKRAGIAAGTVYRYFPSKTDLVGKLIAGVATCELAAVKAAADAAPGPLSALAAAIVTFATRALHARRLIWALSGEAVSPEIDALRLNFRQALAAELEMRIKAAMTGGLLPKQDGYLVAPSIIGALLEGLVGPLVPATDNEAAQRAAVQAAAVISLRALGVVDALARGLVAQCVLPTIEKAS